MRDLDVEGEDAADGAGVDGVVGGRGLAQGQVDLLAEVVDEVEDVADEEEGFEVEVGGPVDADLFG